ncbi:hypothetical protein Aco03nite_054430 [Actinoplanes couchii]|uniref:Nephrocystin 3-like N-terminal domain-containing protein n=1 Tax=Actinoplanes couchii TaxID=403638 RepID=A0ABQ3XEV4_9ACTN|nr:hypothetical protein Aco03nite_054430 [Actinoplanes couchii]
MFLPFDQRPRVIPVRRPLEKVFDQHRHLLIEGGPGTGKSTTAAQICRQLARAWLHADERGRRLTAKPLLPLLVTARSLAVHADKKWPQALAAAASQGLGMAARDSVDPDLLAGAIDSVEWLIVIDGLDEVPGDERETFMAVLSGWTASTDRPWRLLITTRPIAGHATAMLGAGSIGHYTLLPFDRRMLADFAHRWFEPSPEAADRAAGFLSQIASAGLHEVAAVPLMATIAITVYDDDPDSRLPRNRHDLYERYLHWLRQNNAARRSAARAALIAALDGDRHAPALVAALCDRTDDLIEEIAVVRVRSRRSLILTAMEWLRRETGPIGGGPAEDVAELVSEVLLSTGLLSIRDAGPDFIHLTFAEHFAARRFAADLPDRFDAGDAGWRRALHLAVRDEPGAMAVLIRWTKFHPGNGDLLSWLLSGVAADRSTAVRLVAEGAEASVEQTATCLDSLVHQLVGVTIASAVEITAPLRRFPMSPMLVDWLARRLEIAEPGSAAWSAIAAILADRDRSRRSALVAELLAEAAEGDSLTARLAAVVALETIGSDREPELASLLTDALTTIEGTIADRVAVASHLIDREGEPRERALQVMRDALRDVASQVDERRLAAEALAEWDGDSRQLILAELRATLGRPDMLIYELAGTAETTLAVDQSCRSEIAARCSYFLSEMNIDDRSRIEAARLLTELGPEYRSDGVQVLRHLSFADHVSPDDRMHAALKLAMVGEDSWPEVIEAVCRALCDGGRSPRSLVYSVSFGKIERDLRDQIADAIETLTRESGFDAATESRVRSLAVDLDPRFQPDADAGLKAAAARPWTTKETGSHIRRAGECSLPAGGEFFRRLKPIMMSPDIDLSGSLVFSSVSLLRTIRGADDAIDSLVHDLMTTSSTQPRDQLRSALMLMSHPSHYVSAKEVVLSIKAAPTKRWNLLIHYRAVIRQFHPAFDIVESYARDPHIDPTYRVDAVPILIEFMPQRAAEWVSLLPDMLSERTNDSIDRRWIAIRLAENRLLADAVRVLEATVDEAYTPGEERADALSWLAQTERNGTGRYRAGLLALFSDRYELIEHRVQALQTLQRHGDGSTVPPLELTDDLLWAPVPSAYDAQRTAEILFRSGWGRELAVREAIGDLLLRLLARPDPRGYVSPETVRRLALIEGVRAAILTALEAERPTVAAVASAVMVLPQEEAAALAGIRRILEEPAATPGDRARVLELQLGLSSEHRLSAIEGLHTALRTRPDETMPAPIDAVDAARLLYLVVQSRAEAGAELAAVVSDDDETWRRRRAARAVLTEEGGPTALRHADLSYVAEWCDDRLSLTDRCAALVQRADEVPGVLPDSISRLRGALGTVNSRTDRITVLSAIASADPEQNEHLSELLALMSAAEKDFEATIEIARKLSRGTPVQRHRAGLVVERLLDHEDFTPARRLKLLTELKRMLPDTVRRVANEATAIATDSGLNPSVRIQAAVLLAGLGSGASARPAHNVLHDLLNEPETPGYLRVLAGQALLDGPGPQRADTRSRLLELDGHPSDRLAAAIVVLHADGPEPAVRLRRHGPSASQRVIELSTLPDTPPHIVLTAAKALGGTGAWADREAAATILRRLAGDQKVHPLVRLAALAAIPELDFTHASTCAERLLLAVADAGSPFDHRRWAAEGLAEISGPGQRRARDALLALDGSHLDRRARRRLRRSIASIGNGSGWIPGQGVQPGV